MRMLFFVLAAVISFQPLFAGENDELSITLYYNNFGLVKDIRTISIDSGYSFVDFDGISPKIKPASVNFRCLDDENVYVIEQSYFYDLVSLSKLLKRYIGSTIEVKTFDGTKYIGELLQFEENSRSEDGFIFIGGDSGEIITVSKNKIIDVKFPFLSNGLITKPKLHWKLYAQISGDKKCEVSYLADGMKWNADYIAIVLDDDKEIELSSWVTINNESGADYEDTNLDLVAGYIHRPGRGQMGKIQVAAERRPRPGPEFEEEQFFEYYMYSLDESVTLFKDETKQLALFPKTIAEVEKVYMLDTKRSAYSSNDKDKLKVRVNLAFENSLQSGLGMPLPKGNLRVYKEDSRNRIQFVGADEIDHTPKNDKVLIYLGDAFDISAYHRKMNVEKKGKKRIKETYEVTIENFKDEDIIVTIAEYPKGWDDWKIVDSSLEYRKISNFKIEFDIAVKANDQAQMSYTVDYKKR